MKRFCGFPPTPEFTGDLDEMSLLAGESVGQTKRLMSVSDIIDEMMEGAETQIRKRLGSIIAGHHAAKDMSEEGAQQDSAAPIAASLAEFTEKLIARRGVEQANVLFGGQIGPATQALSARTSSIGVGDLAPDFSLPTAQAQTWSLAAHLAQSNSLLLLWFSIVAPGAATATFTSVGCSQSIAAVRRQRCLDCGVAGGHPRFP